MIVLIDTSTGLCKLTLVEGETQNEHKWQADRQLARGLHTWLKDVLADHGKEWQDITGIGVYSGPGSFTGLRIGLTVCNTLAQSLEVPIVGETDENWRNTCLDRLKEGDNDTFVMPHYGADATITSQRK